MVRIQTASMGEIKAGSRRNAAWLQAAFVIATAKHIDPPDLPNDLHKSLHDRLHLDVIHKPMFWGHPFVSPVVNEETHIVIPTKELERLRISSVAR